MTQKEILEIAEQVYGKCEWSEAALMRLVTFAKLVAAHPQPTEERNFCPRCGKRTNDIHTCTPPKADHIEQHLEMVEQEPVIDKSAAIRIATALGWQPKREWVELTDEEINKLRYKKDWTAPWTDMT